MAIFICNLCKRAEHGGHAYAHAAIMWKAKTIMSLPPRRNLEICEPCFNRHEQVIREWPLAT